MSYLQDWNGTWRVRFPVPKHVQPVLKRERLIQSLGTKCQDEAMRLAIPVLDKFKDMISLAEAGAWPPPDDATVARIVSNWRDWAAQANFFAAYGGSLAFRTEAEFDASLKHYLIGSGTGIRPDNSWVYDRFRRRAKDCCQILDRDDATPVSVDSVAERPWSTARRATKVYQFETLMAHWAKERKKPQRTQYQWGRIIAKLTKFLGHQDINQTTESDYSRWKDHLVEHSGLSLSTIKNHLIVVNTLLNHAVANRTVTGMFENPMTRVCASVRVSKKKRRHPGFTDEQAASILRAARTQSEPHKRWIPWIVADNGARVDEVAGAVAKDVEKVAGIWCLHIRTDHRQGDTIKNEVSERTVPLSDKLIAEGFLVYWENLDKEGPLFPDITPDRFGRRGANGVRKSRAWARVFSGALDAAPRWPITLGMRSCITIGDIAVVRISD